MKKYALNADIGLEIIIGNKGNCYFGSKEDLLNLKRMGYESQDLEDLLNSTKTMYYDEITIDGAIDLSVEQLWEEFGEVRFKAYSDATRTAEDWYIFSKGTDIYAIRNWFDANHSGGLKYLQNMGV